MGEQAIPIDQLRNGAETAMGIFSWGVETLKEQAVKANESLQESENFQKVKEQYEANLKPTLEGAVEGANEFYEQKAKPTLTEIGAKIGESTRELVEQSKPVLEQAGEKISKTVESCRPALEKAKSTVG